MRWPGAASRRLSVDERRGNRRCCAGSLGSGRSAGTIRFDRDVSRWKRQIAWATLKPRSAPSAIRSGRLRARRSTLYRRCSGEQDRGSHGRFPDPARAPPTAGALSTTTANAAWHALMLRLHLQTGDMAGAQRVAVEMSLRARKRSRWGGRSRETGAAVRKSSRELPDDTIARP